MTDQTYKVGDLVEFESGERLIIKVIKHTKYVSFYTFRQGYVVRGDADFTLVKEADDE